MSFDIIVTLSPLLIAVFTALYYHMKAVSKVDTLQNEILNLSQRLERLETSISQDIRDLTQKLDRIMYTLASRSFPKED